MTPAPEQNAKRETPRTDAIICQWSESAKLHTPDLAHYRQGCEVLETHAKDLETELQQLRLAADGMAESLKEARRFLFETPFGGIHRDAILVQINQISKSEAAYRADGEGAPKDTGTSRE